MLFLRRAHSPDCPPLDSIPLPTNCETRALTNAPPGKQNGHAIIVALTWWHEGHKWEARVIGRSRANKGGCTAEGVCRLSWTTGCVSYFYAAVRFNNQCVGRVLCSDMCLGYNYQCVGLVLCSTMCLRYNYLCVGRVLLSVICMGTTSSV